MTLGLAPTQGDLLRGTVGYCQGLVPEDSIYAVLHRECFNLFPDGMFADLFTDVGRRSVPPMIVAVVMVLQRIEGCSDREAVDRFAFDARWKYAAGGLAFDHPGFVHTVLVDMRARLAASDAPDRIFQATLEAARAAGLVGRKRVLDSTPLYDAVATMDTVTLIRSAIRGLLRVADAGLEARLRAVLTRDDEYVSAGKPVCAWDDAAARTEVVDALAKDGHAALALLDGQQVSDVVARVGELLATVLGQDLDCVDGVFRIARRVAKDRVISTVDLEARHGHKTAARGFDGYKGHLAIDPDSEIITATDATAGNTGDADPAAGLLAGELGIPASPDPADESAGQDTEKDLGQDTGDGHDGPAIEAGDGHDEPAPDAGDEAGRGVDGGGAREQDRLAVYGDAAYGAGALLVALEAAGATVMVKVQPPVAPGGRYAKDRFTVDTAAGTVTCPAGVTVPIRQAKAGGGTAAFGAACAACPLAGACTASRSGRTISIGPYEAELVRARHTQQDPGWLAEYRATRPKVERKIGHLMRRKHGGRRARVRGLAKVKADFSLLAAAVNIARLGVLKISRIAPSAPAVVPA
ncbi:transposase [Specibacter cremeus]|uniref:transposase n=1 Tax=Specibacter cremeus TaxID=1629051 RepID=UPI000F78F3B6|nr:transposase [Specibacter cremeus]